MRYINYYILSQYSMAVAVESIEIVCCKICGLDFLGLVTKFSLFNLQYALIIELKAACN